MLKTLSRIGWRATAAFLCTLSIAATANAEPFEVSTYRIESDDCPGCAKVYLQTEAQVFEYMDSMRELMSDGKGNGVGPTYNGFEGRPNRKKQVVFVDFDAGGDPTFPVCNSDGTLFGIFNDHIYTPEERKTILARIRNDYSQYKFKITDKRPESGEFTTLFLGQNDAPVIEVPETGQLFCPAGSNITTFPGGGLSILFGRAEGIDFRNQNRDDNAFADGSFWEFLAQLDAQNAEAGFPTNNFEALSGVSPDDFGGDIVAAVSFAVTNQSSNTGAHEVGHLLGLRHQQSLGPPGSGLPDTFRIFPEDFVPVFELGDGEFPFQADETVLHTMASGASVGLPLTGSTLTDRFFSERSAVRLAFNERGRVRFEDDIRAQNLYGYPYVELKMLNTPNTIEIGINAAACYWVESITVQGNIDEVGEIDRYYIWVPEGGDMLNVELISIIGEQLSFDEGILGQVRVYQVDDDGTEELIGINQQSFESVFDAEVFDLVLPEKGWYAIEISAPDEFFPADFDGDFILDPFPISAAGAPELLTGSYSVLIYTFRPEFYEDYEEMH